MRAKSNRVREGDGRRFLGSGKGKEKSFCFVVVQFELIFRHPCFYVVCACTEFFGEVRVRVSNEPIIGQLLTNLHLAVINEPIIGLLPMNAL